MTDTNELVKRLRSWTVPNHLRESPQHECHEAAQAIERLEASEKAADKLAIEAWNKTAKLEEKLAEERAEIERLRPALTGLLDAVDRKDMDSVDCRHFRPYQDKAREALATPASIETTGKAAVMDPTIAKKQQENGDAK